eukprot:TRINITY_DN5317_c0_g1_i2.p1 TRINITY_DN5317_c0_g1~~TRINITY_DN5317_c0_g1_i2.p1  ORF type:complete len:118 (+),score=2.89 TRINITY_DN5317_c0_g1_i2:72-425(+)
MVNRSILSIIPICVILLLFCCTAEGCAVDNATTCFNEFSACVIVQEDEKACNCYGPYGKCLKNLDCLDTYTYNEFLKSCKYGGCKPSECRASAGPIISLFVQFLVVLGVIFMMNLLL